MPDLGGYKQITYMTKETNWLDNLRSQIIEKKDAANFDDIIRCYQNGLLRAGFLMAWLMLIESFKRKVVELADKGVNVAISELKTITTTEDAMHSNDEVIWKGALKCDLITKEEDNVWSYFYIMMPGMRAVHDRLKKLSEGETKSEAFLKVSSKLLNPFILRRTKAEYLKELPECVERNIYVNMSKEEREVYHTVHRVFGKALKDGTSGRVTSIALEALLRLRQACVSVNLLPRTLYRGGQRMSTKMELALAQIGQLGKEDKIIVFSQFVQALEELEEYLKERDIAYVTLYATTSDRETPVTTFQKDADVKVFLASIKAGA